MSGLSPNKFSYKSNIQMIEFILFDMDTKELLFKEPSIHLA